MCLEVCFWKRLALDSGDWVKRFTSPVWINIIQSTEGRNGTWKVTEGWIASFLSLSLSLSVLELGHPSSALWPQSSWFSGLQTLGLPPVTCLKSQLFSDLYLPAPVLRSVDEDWIIPPTFLVLQLASSRSWDFLASIRLWMNYFNKSPLTYIYIFF